MGKISASLAKSLGWPAERGRLTGESQVAPAPCSGSGPFSSGEAVSSSFSSTPKAAAGAGRRQPRFLGAVLALLLAR